MTTATDTMGQVHEVLDPLEHNHIISTEECDDLCRKIAEFLQTVRAEGMPTDEAYWQAFQYTFDFARTTPVVTPMNAANLCPEPRALLDAANTLRVAYNRNVAQQTRMAGGERVIQIERARLALALGIGLTNSSDLAIVRNASEGNNAISCGYRNWDRTTGPANRENVVLWSENHPTNLEAWRLRAQWESTDPPLFDVVVVPFQPAWSDDRIADEFIDRIGERTRFVSFSDTANSTGFRMPATVIDRIWQHVQVHRPNCHVHIDGTMAWGARAIDLSNPRCHSFVSSAHKWFLGPKETGILYVHPDKARHFAPGIFAYNYKIEIGPWPDMPGNALRFELIGQRDDVNIITLELTQMMWQALAPRQPYQRVAFLAQYLKDRLQQTPGRWPLVTPASPSRSLGVVRIEAPQGNRMKSLYHWLYDERRIAGSGDDRTFRLCPHIYNTRGDIDNAVAGMNAWFEGRP